MTEPNRDDSELERTLEAARRAEPSWSAGRQHQIKWALMARVGRGRRPALRLGLAMAVVTLMVAGFGWWTHQHGSSVAPSAGDAPLAVERPLPRLADGSSIVLDGPSAILKTVRESSDEVVVQLEAGGAHFEVARRPSRIFRVQAGPVTVQVIGTRFHVRREGARTRISVDRGRVLASWWGGSRELGVGDEGTFPPESAGTETRAAESPTTPPPTTTTVVTGGAIPVPRLSPGPKRAVAPSPSRTPTSLARGAQSAAPRTPQALFALADQARSEGRPDAAVGYLREIVERYPNDPHAPMAAFTEGRLLLEALKQPRSAAGAFGRARALAAHGPLAEDALARQVEALAAAGDAAAARAHAELYRGLYPHGPRLNAVMRFAGVQAAP